MTATAQSSNEIRLHVLKSWLATVADAHALNISTLRTASSDASFRHYYRIDTSSGTAIVMDAPPPHEDCGPFLHVTSLLQQGGLNVPEILAQDTKQGFLLLSDLGELSYYQAIQVGLSDSQLQLLYRNAITALVAMQQHAPSTGLPPYDSTRLLEELAVFPEWYAAHHCQSPLNEQDMATVQQAFTLLANDAAKQPQVLVHRDFHSPNLMVFGQLDNAKSTPTQTTGPALIDYQDALLGPITYDIASLIMDARTTWEEPQQLDWAIRYWEAARAANLPVHADFADFHQAYEWMSLQRNLRILGVFARLSHRDGKHNYLEHIPRVNAYARQVASRYGVLAPLRRVLDKLDNIQVTTGYTF
ncbi:phosphotransferase [Alcaligenaceae bacterium]|nr:phosphotransferase [Alcaligenaceae bacterium]